jgi:hypothetical protein
MRYLLGFLCVCGLVGTLPLSASAQAEESEEAPKQAVEQEPAPSSEPASEEPALQLKLDAAGVDITPTPPRTFDGYTLEELELRKRRAALGLIAPAAVGVAGVALLVSGTSGDCYSDLSAYQDRDACRRPYAAGMVLTIAGGVGMIVGSVLAGHRAKEFRRAKGYTLEEMELRVKKARRGLIGTSVILGVGVVLVVGGAVCSARNPPPPEELIYVPSCFGLIVFGLVPTWVGFIGMIVSGPVLGARKRKLRRLQQAHYGTPRRVQWDLARSRLVF